MIGGTMAIDYDVPRRTVEDAEDGVDGIEELRAAQLATAVQRPDIDADDTGAEAHELPGADLSDEALVIKVVPKALNEFTCASCFLVFHNGARSADDPTRCRDCA